MIEFQPAMMGERPLMEVEKTGQHNHGGDTSRAQNEDNGKESSGRIAVPVPLRARAHGSGSCREGLADDSNVSDRMSHVFRPIGRSAEEKIQGRSKVEKPYQNESDPQRSQQAPWKLRMRPRGATFSSTHGPSVGNLALPRPPSPEELPESDARFSATTTPQYVVAIPSTTSPPDPPALPVSFEGATEEELPPDVLLPTFD